MCNRFKFRVWLKECGEYATPDNITDIMNEYCFVSCFDNDHKHGCMGYESGDRTDVTIEQCTGLKDKNGVLIYEGDIVRMDHMYHECYCDEFSCVCPPVKGDTIGFVALLPSEGYVLKNNHFIDGEGEFIAKRKKYCKLYSTHEIYVIGNIHDNPELLEATNV